MANSTQRFQAQVAVAKILKFSYDRDSGFVSSLSKDAGPFTLELSQRGEVIISGRSGNLSFSLDEKQRATLGPHVRWFSVRFGVTEAGYLSYGFSGQVGVLTINFSGVVDFDDMLKSCSGLLCNAYLVINADTRYEAAAKKAFIK